MQTYLISFLSTLIPLLAIDFVWLSSTMKSFYSPRLAHLTAESPVLSAGAVFYILYAIGLVFLIINPAIQQGTGLLKVFIQGLVLGLMAYGAYDLTNHATLRDWPLSVTVVDMIWGSILTGFVSVLAVYLTKHFS